MHVCSTYKIQVDWYTTQTEGESALLSKFVLGICAVLNRELIEFTESLTVPKSK